MRHPEDDLQRAVVQYLDVALPADAVAYAVPNGGKRSRTEAARLKGLGVRAGVPDLAIVWRAAAWKGRGMNERQRQDIIRGLGCLVPGCRLEPVELHHVRSAATSGTGLKPSDKWIVPLCWWHHQEGDRIGWQTWRRKYGIDLAAAAREFAQIDREMP